MVPRASKAQGEALQEWNLHFVEVDNKENSKVHKKGNSKLHNRSAKEGAQWQERGEADIGPALQPTFAHPCLTLPGSVAH